MKKLSRVLALSLAFIMLIGTTTFAAVPNNSVTIGNRAISIDYIFNYLEDAKVLVNSLLDENPDSSIFFQLDGQNERFTDPFTGTEATEEDLAEVSVFIDENGEEQELEQKELEVVKVSAINDLDSKTVKVKGEVVKAEELEGEVAIVAELFEADKDGKFPEEGTEVTVELDEDGKFEFEVIDVEKYNAGEYKVVIKVTVGEEEAEAVAEFVIDKDELEAIDAVVDAVNKATNQPALLKALQADEFENVDAELIIKYEQELGTAPRSFKTVSKIQEIIDKVNSGETETELLEAIKEAVTDNNQIKLEELLKSAKLEVEVDGEKVAVEVKDGIIEDYRAALQTKNDYTSLAIVAATIKTENERPLVEVNGATTATDMKTALVKNADRLGLDLTAFNKIDSVTGQPGGRQTAVLNDLIDNMPEDGYTEETLKLTFDEIVATRMVFQKSVELFETGKAEEPLKDLTYITMLIENLEATEHHTKHSGKTIKGKGGLIEDLQKLVDRFDALEGEKVTLEDDEEPTDAQKAVLKTINYNEPLSSTITRNRLNTALTAIEKMIAPEKVKEEYKAVAKIAEALGLKDTDGAFSAAKTAVEALTAESTEENIKAAKDAIKALEQVIDLNQAIKDEDASAVEEALLALNAKYDETNLYADLAKVNRVELAEELIEATEDLIVDANNIKLSDRYTAYNKKIDAVNKATTNSKMKEALEAIVGEDKVTLEQAEEFINAFPVDKDGERVPYTTLADIIAAIK